MNPSSKTPIEVIANATQIPGFEPPAVKALMAKLNLNEKAFALLMNVSPMTVRLWTSGAVKPCNPSRRLMQIYSLCPSVVDCIAGDSREEVLKTHSKPI